MPVARSQGSVFRRLLWSTAAIGWASLIAFSSTTLAARLAAGYFERLIYSFLHVQRYLSAPAQRWLMFLAEKGLHVVLFAIFGWMLWKAFPTSMRTFTTVVAAGAAAGIASELLQALFPHRDPTIRDVAINLISFTAGVLVARAGSQILDPD